MVTKSLSDTPFGKKLIYRIDGECIWSEYLPVTAPEEKSATVSFRRRAENMFGHIKKGVRNVFLLKAS